MKQRGPLKIFAFLFLAATCLVASPAVAAPPPAVPASSSPRLKYIPKDYWLVAEVDFGLIARIMTSPQAQANPQFAQFQQMLQMVKQFTAIDLEKDVDYATVFLAGSPDEMKMLAVVQGSFKNDVVAKRLVVSLADSITEKKHKGHKIYEVNEYTFAFPEGSTILVGEADLVTGALDRLDAKTQQVPDALKKVLDRTPGNAAGWVAVQPRAVLDHKALAEWRTANGELQRALRKLDTLSVFFDLSDEGLQIKALGYAAAPGGAASVYKYLSDRKKNILHEEGTNVVFTSLLILSALKADGAYVEGSFRITPEAFKELWDTRVIVRPEGRPPEKKDK